MASAGSTPPHTTPDGAEPSDPDLGALEGGRAFVDRSGMRLVRVAGSDAPRWLDDLVTADVGSLHPGEARRSLLLSPTGHIRAMFHVARMPDGFLLAQDRDQPEAIDALLVPYVLSSNVQVVDVSGTLAVFCLPGREDAPGGLPTWRPSILGGGVDAVAPADHAAEARAALLAELVEVEEAAVERWRILGGAARFGVDLDERSIPAEAGLGWMIAFEKGCFLGQESVARVRNLGHPPRVLRAARTGEPVPAGAEVTAGGRSVGRVTSATSAGDGAAVLALVAWDARDAALVADGVPLTTVEAVTR